MRFTMIWKQSCYLSASIKPDNFLASIECRYPYQWYRVHPCQPMSQPGLATTAAPAPSLLHDKAVCRECHASSAHYIIHAMQCPTGCSWFLGLSGLLCKDVGIVGLLMLLSTTGPQVALQCGAEDLIDQGQRLAIVPEDIVPAPKGAPCLKLPARSK